MSMPSNPTTNLRHSKNCVQVWEQNTLTYAEVDSVDNNQKIKTENIPTKKSGEKWWVIFNKSSNKKRTISYI
jgi:hypothetical protein